MAEQKSVIDKFFEIGREWAAESVVLEKYGESKTAALLRDHSTIVMNLAAAAKRELVNQPTETL